MKKFNLAKIASLLFVCAMLMGALTIAAFATGEDDVVIASNNVYYGEKYQIMYAIKAPEGATITAVDSKGNTVGIVAYKNNPVLDSEGNHLKDENGEYKYVDYITKDGVNYKTYITKGGVAAQAIDEVITVTVTAGEKTATQSYSVLQYIYERRNVKNNVGEDEGRMFDALIAYADAANAFIDKETVSFNEYKYVTVVNGTLDGSNKAGMFLNGATPFENIVATPDYDINAYNVEWDVSVDGAEAERYDNDAIKTLAVSGNMTVTRVLVESECTHEWSEATCTTLATCSKCGETTGELADHTPQTDAAVAPTCSATGLTEGSHCSVCDKVLVKQDEVAIDPDNHNFVDGVCEYCQIEETKTTDTQYTFSNYPEGVQYAKNEVHVLDETLTVVTSDAHFTSELRLYSSSTNNAFAIFKSTKPITKISVNAGNKVDTLVVYGSNDEGATWTELTKISVTSTSYKDYEAELNGSYKWIKLDVEGSNQIRIKSITLTTVNCNHSSTSTTTINPTCTEPGYTVTVCDSCGAEQSKVENGVAALGHTDVDHRCTVCGAEGISDHVDDDADGRCDACDHEMGTPDTPVLTNKEYSYTFSSKVFSANGTVSLNEVDWTLDGDGGYWGKDTSGRGQQFGSNNKPYKSMTLVSESFSNVSNVTINTCGGTAGGTVKVYVGTTLVGTITITTTASEYSFNVSDLSGAVKFEYTNASKALYILSIGVTYAE